MGEESDQGSSFSLAKIPLYGTLRTIFGTQSKVSYDTKDELCLVFSGYAFDTW
jgi:hypothetical protein